MPELLDYIPMEQENRGIYTYIKETILSGSDLLTQTGDQAVAAAIKAEGIAFRPPKRLQKIVAGGGQHPHRRSLMCR